MIQITSKLYEFNLIYVKWKTCKVVLFGREENALGLLFGLFQNRLCLNLVTLPW